MKESRKESRKGRREFIKDMAKYFSGAVAAVGLISCRKAGKPGFVVMPHKHEGFRSKKQLFNSLRINMKPVSPTLKLSPEALKTPLPQGWLSSTREFLTRSGKWERHPIQSNELFRITPAPGVIPEPRVIGPSAPIFTSLGFGELTVRDEIILCRRNVCEIQYVDGWKPDCRTHMCITFRAPEGFLPGEDFWCLSYGSASMCPEACPNDCDADSPDCPGQGCEGYCDNVECNGIYCPNVTEYPTDPGIVTEFETYWNHPFVEELRTYFDVSSVEKLTKSVTHYIGRNMYDASVL